VTLPFSSAPNDAGRRRISPEAARRQAWFAAAIALVSIGFLLFKMIR
jgi:hypothetical protein